MTINAPAAAAAAAAKAKAVAAEEGTGNRCLYQVEYTISIGIVCY